MFKVNKDIAKKSIKQIMVISAIATLLMAAMGSIPSMKSYAQRDGMDFMKMVPGMEDPIGLMGLTKEVLVQIVSLDVLE